MNIINLKFKIQNCKFTNSYQLLAVVCSLIAISLLFPHPSFAQEAGVDTALGHQTSISGYISTAINTWAIPLAGIAALLMITFAGFLYVTSAGNSAGIERAKELIVGAVLGLFTLFMIGYVIQYIIPAEELDPSFGYIAPSSAAPATPLVGAQLGTSGTSGGAMTDGSFALNVPFVHGTSGNCNKYAVLMTARYYAPNAPIKFDQSSGSCSTNGLFKDTLVAGGISPSDIKGITRETHSPHQWDKIFSIVQGGDPVVIHANIYSGSGHNGHWVTVTGFSADKKTAYFNDDAEASEATGKNKKMAISDKRWKANYDSAIIYVTWNKRPAQLRQQQERQVLRALVIQLALKMSVLNASPKHYP